MTNSMVVNLAGSGQVSPTYLPQSGEGVSYSIVMQTPQYQIGFAQRAEEPADHGAGRDAADARRDRRHQSRGASAVVSQYNIQAMVQIYATTQGRDLGAVAADVQKVVDEMAGNCRSGAQVYCSGRCAR